MKEPRVWLKASGAAKYLGISLPTLKKIEEEGKLVPFLTPGEHRRYTVEMLDEYLESTQKPPAAEAAADGEADKRMTAKCTDGLEKTDSGRM